jgi:TnpA family transposase
MHADTQGQSIAIFGLAHLLGIQLMPRIRNWKEQRLYRASANSRYEHIDALFDKQIEWDLIETMAPDMLRVAVSIQTGALLPSDILRRLTSSNRKNKLYFALRELGRVVRTILLLRYISDLDLRHTTRRRPPRVSGSIALSSGYLSAATASSRKTCEMNSANS